MNFPFDPKIILELFPIALTWVCVMMFAFWGLGTVLRNAGLVDLGWVSGLVSLAVIYFVNLDGYLPRQLLMLLMVSVWAGRLFVLLLLRLIKERREDPRYAKMRTGSEAAVHLKLFLMFQFQGVLDLVLSVPFFLVFINPSDKIVGVEW